MTLRHRLSACAVLAAFLAAQTWMVCPVSCLVAAAGAGSPAPSAVTGMRMGAGDAYCRPHMGLHARLPTMQQGLSPMLAAEPAVVVPAGRQVPSGPELLSPRVSRSLPSTDPPPPRSV